MSTVVRAAMAVRHIARSGWMMKGVPPAMGEDVAQHEHLAAIIALVLSREVEGVDRRRAVEMALVHDLAEALMGDIASSEANADLRASKAAAEAEAAARLEDGELAALISEFSRGASREAKLARLADRAATYLVGAEYRGLGYRVEGIMGGVRGEAEAIARELGLPEEVLDGVLRALD